MSSQPKAFLTPEEYLALERKAEYKSEYFQGEMFALAGATSEHNTIAGNIFGKLRQQLKAKPCRAYISDMRVRIPVTGLYTYPDVIVVCGEPRFDDEYSDTLLNPTVLVEVLSPSTESYDAEGNPAIIGRSNRSRNTCWSRKTNTKRNNIAGSPTAGGCSPEFCPRKVWSN